MKGSKKPPPGWTVTALYYPKHGNPREWPQAMVCPRSVNSGLCALPASPKKSPVCRGKLAGLVGDFAIGSAACAADAIVAPELPAQKKNPPG
jgi:hypothetical protein